MATEDAPPAALQTFVLRVSIHCHGCKKKVRKVLRNIEGVQSVHVDTAQHKVTVTGTVDADTLVKRLYKSGKQAMPWHPTHKDPEPAPPAAPQPLPAPPAGDGGSKDVAASAAADTLPEEKAVKEPQAEGSEKQPEKAAAAASLLCLAAWLRLRFLRLCLLLCLRLLLRLRGRRQWRGRRRQEEEQAQGGRRRAGVPHRGGGGREVPASVVGGEALRAGAARGAVPILRTAAAGAELPHGAADSERVVLRGAAGAGLLRAAAPAAASGVLPAAPGGGGAVPRARAAANAAVVAVVPVHADAVYVPAHGAGVVLPARPLQPAGDARAAAADARLVPHLRRREPQRLQRHVSTDTAVTRRRPPP